MTCGRGMVARQPDHRFRSSYPGTTSGTVWTRCGAWEAQPRPRPVLQGPPGDLVRMAGVSARSVASRCAGGVSRGSSTGSAQAGPSGISCASPLACLGSAPQTIEQTIEAIRMPPRAAHDQSCGVGRLHTFSGGTAPGRRTGAGRPRTQDVPFRCNAGSIRITENRTVRSGRASAGSGLSRRRVARTPAGRGEGACSPLPTGDRVRAVGRLRPCGRETPAAPGARLSGNGVHTARVTCCGEVIRIIGAASSEPDTRAETRNPMTCTPRSRSIGRRSP